MLPPRTDPRWDKLVDRPDQQTYNFLALKILMQRIAGKRDSMSADQRTAFIDEVYSFFQKNEKLVSSDIATIFG